MTRIGSVLGKRGLPVTIEGLKACSGSYSQFGEDMILSPLFSREGPPKLYLDLGCYHPLTWSNAYHFYRRGWMGVAVDATDKFRLAWKRYRPRDVHWVRAIVPTSSHRLVNFVESTGHPATSFCRLEAEGKEVDEQSNDLRCLAIADLAQWWPFKEPPTIVSTDLEGLDLDIWMHFPFHHFMPEALVLELHTADEAREKLLGYLTSIGYRLCGMTGPSFIFRREQSDYP